MKNKIYSKDTRKAICLAAPCYWRSLTPWLSSIPWGRSQLIPQYILTVDSSRSSIFPCDHRRQSLSLMGPHFGLSPHHSTHRHFYSPQFRSHGGPSNSTIDIYDLTAKLRTVNSLWLGSHLRQNWDKFVLIRTKCQIPVNSWPRQMRPTCLYADKKLPTETNLQRSRRPATNQDLLSTTNKKCFPWHKVVDQFQKALKM